MKKRIMTFDIAKAIAILLVVFGHALAGIRDSSNLTLTSSYKSIVYICDIIYTFHMPLFFFISGIFVSNWQKRNIKTAFWQKFQSLMIPYFIWSIFTGSFMQLAQKYTNNGQGMKQVLLSWLTPFSEYWFLYCLFFIFIIYYILINCLKLSIKTIFIISVLLYLLYPITPDFWISKQLAGFFIYFAGGSLLSKTILENHDKLFTLKKFIASVIAFIVVMLAYSFVITENGNELIIWITRFITAISGIWITLALSHELELNTTRLSSKLSTVGKESMSIYVMHLLPLAGARIFALKLVHISNLWSLSIIITIIALICCYIGYWIINKLKLSKYMFGR